MDADSNLAINSRSLQYISPVALGAARISELISFAVPLSKDPEERTLSLGSSPGVVQVRT